MKFLLIVLLAILTSGCVSTMKEQYNGADAGYAVVSVGASKEAIYDRYDLMYRKLHSDSYSGSFIFIKDQLFTADKIDYDSGAEAGVINVHKLAPGNYEIYSTYAETKAYYFRATRIFSLKFSIYPNKVTYLGSYQGKGVLKDGEHSGVYFKLTDRMDRDLELAKKYKPDISYVDVYKEVPRLFMDSEPFISRDD